MIHATIAGRLGKDADLKTTQSGKVVCNFNLATKGREKDATTWVRCALWGKRAESLAQYLTKGSTVQVVGSLSASEYEGKAQINLDVQEIELLGGGAKQDDDKPRSRTKDTSNNGWGDSTSDEPPF